MLPSPTMKTKLAASAATPPAAVAADPEGSSSNPALITPPSKPSPLSFTADDPVEGDPELCDEEEDPEVYEEEDPEEEIEGEWEEVEEEIEEEVDDDDDDEERLPEPVKRKRKLREFEVFVGGLPRETVEEDLARALMRVGEVVEVRLVRDPVTGLNKGFAFVRFAKVEQARRAVMEVKLVQVKGKMCGLTRNNENESLHLGNICRTWTKDDLIEKLEAFDLENLEEVDLIEDTNNMGMNRGYAFLHFSTHMDAVAALSKFQKRVIFFGVDVRAEVNFSRVGQPDEEVMAHVKSVFLDGLPVTWDEPRVREHFEQFGKIESVRLARNLPNAKRKDFGFIYFATRQAALDCIEVVNKDGISEGSGKVLIKATLRKPRLKQTHPMLGVRRGYIGKNYEMRPQSYVANRSYPGRHAESRGFFGKRGFRGQFSSRGRFFPPVEKFGGRLREDFVRDIPDQTNNRPREPYVQSGISRGSYMQSGRSRGSYMRSGRPRGSYTQSGRFRGSYMQRSRFGGPYMQHTNSGNPAMQCSSSGDPYMQRSSSGDPYMERSSSGGPYTHYRRSGNPDMRNSRSREPYMQRRRSQDPYTQSTRSREHYMQRPSRSGSGEVASYPDATYPKGRGQRGDYIYNEPHEIYEHPVEPGYKTSYPDIDDHMLTPRSLMRRVRTTLVSETNAHPRVRDAAEDEYSRFGPDEHLDYGNIEPDADREYGSRYSPQPGASRT